MSIFAQHQPSTAAANGRTTKSSHPAVSPRPVTPISTQPCTPTYFAALDTFLNTRQGDILSISGQIDSLTGTQDKLLWCRSLHEVSEWVRVYV